MTDPEHSREDSEDPVTPMGEKENPAPTEEFIRALDAFQKGMSANNAEQVEAATWKAMQIAVEEAEKNPTPDRALILEARQREARGDWAGAEACHREVLAIREATGNFGLIFKAHYDLSHLFLLLGDIERADQAAQAAIVAARKADVFPVLMMALETRAICALRRSDYAGALERASEAVAVIEPGNMYDGMRAGALVSRARCRLASGDLEGGERDLATCKPVLIDRAVSPILAGWHGKAAAWWEVTAGIHAQQGNLVRAGEAWAEAVKGRRHVASLPQVAGPYTLAALARSLRGQGEALGAAGKSEEGEIALAEAQNIWRELGLPEQRVW